MIREKQAGSTGLFFHALCYVFTYFVLVHVQRVGQFLLEVVLDELDGQLGIEGVQRRRIALRYRDAVHGPSPLMFQYGKEYTPHRA